MPSASPTFTAAARRWRACLLALALLLGATNLLELGISMQPHFWQTQAAIGLSGQPEAGALRVGAVEPAADPALRQLRQGDLVSWDAPAPAFMPAVLKFLAIYPRTAEISLTARRDTQVFTLHVHPTVPVSTTALVNFYGQIIGDLVFALVGALLIYRRPDLLSIRALSLGMICWSSCIPLVAPVPWFDLLFIVNKGTARLWYTVMLIYWAIHQTETSRWGLSRFLRRAWPGWAAATVALSLFVTYVELAPGARYSALWDQLAQANLVLIYVMTLLALIEGAGGTEGEARTRIKWGLFIFALSFVMFPYRIYAGAADPAGTSALLAIIDISLQMVLPLGLLYATLRHNLVDLGFVIHRGLVYASVSSLLVLSIAGLERLSSHFIHVQSQEENALRNGAIALAIFLFFHKIRGWVNVAIERVFFSSWKEKDLALRTFIKRSVHITDTAPLVDATIAELDRFAAPTTSAIYRLVEDGGYRRVGASMQQAPLTVGANDPLVVAMRFEDKPAPADMVGQLPLEVMALPMVYRGRLDGFVLLHRAGGREVFRPDQLVLLAEAVREVGLGLAALDIDQQNRHSHEQEQEINTLRSHASELRSILEAVGKKAAT